MKKQVTVEMWSFKPPQFLNKLLVLLMLSISSFQALAQVGIVTGKVLDDKGEPIIGATIEVIDAFKKNIGGTVTDMDGNYSIEVKDMNLSSLKFSFLGNKTQTILVKGQTVIDTKLAEDSEVLEEVVATGYVNQTKPKVTGSISSISEKDLKLTNNATLENAMQGRSSGVQVTNNTGTPGAAASVRIRGVGSVNGGEPLYVIDGVPVTADALNLLNPSDIQTVDILKDASAAAIYGTRASNGVVMITTKKGKEGKMAVSFDANYGWQQVWNKISMMQTSEYLKYMKEIYPGNTLPYAFRNPNNPYLNNNTNWQDNAFKTGITQNYNINLSGGTDKLLYSVSGGVFDQKGILPGADFKRYSLRINTEIKPKKWLTFGENVSMSNSKESPLNMDLGQILKAPPIIPVKDENGNYASADTALTGSFDGINQLAYPDSRDFRNNNYRILGNVYTEITLLKKLKYKLNLGLDVFNGITKNIRSPFNIGRGTNFSNDPPQNRTVSDLRVYRFSPLMDHTLYYSDTINKKHEYGVLVGTSLQSFFSSSINVQNDNVGNGIEVSSFEGKGKQNGGRDDIYALRGYFGRFTYSYNNKYLLTANVRYDGSSKFPTSSKYALFPSMSVGWRLLEEKFIKNIPFVNAYFSDLKVRYGWGQTGNQEGISNNTSLFLFNDKPRDPFNSGSGGIAPANTPNTSIKWETVTQSNIGLDMSLFKNKLSLVVDYFVKTSKDMIIPIPVLYSVGFRPEGDGTPQYWGNAGSMQNKGLEMALTFRNDDNAFKYSLTGNISFLSNKIVKLANNDAPLYSGDPTITITQKNSAVGEFFGYEKIGIFQTGETVNYSFANGDDKYKPKAGDVKYLDANGDGILNADDRKVLGSNIPKFIYGFNASAEYKGLDLKIFFQGVQGNKLYNQLRSSIEGMSNGGPQSGNQAESIQNRWTPDNQSSEMPRATGDRIATNYNNLLSSRWIESGSFLRLKTVQLGYTIPSKILSKIFKTKEGEIGTRIYVSAYNLLTFTKYKGLDPEVGGTVQAGNTGRPNEVNPLLAGVDNGAFPQSKSFNMGIQLNF